MSPRLWSFGLRTRLLVAFALVTMVGAGAAAWSSAATARTALVSSNQHATIDEFRSQISLVAPTLGFPPDQASIDRLHDALGEDALVRFDGITSASGGVVSDLLTTGLLDAVRRDHRLVTQRVVVEGHPWLLVGTPITITAPDGSHTPSGIEVYVAEDLSAVDDQISGIARSALKDAALALPLAVVLALLAAGSVLRPVRNLRDTARRLADGDLDARSPSLGSDELAELGVTVNEMADSLQAMQADAKRFVADVSHELRTPLTTLAAVMEVLASTTGTMEPDARESAELAVTETRRLVGLVEDLMEVSRFDAGTAELRLEDVDLDHVVRRSLRARGWLAEVELSSAGETQARLDPRRIDVIIANLVGNALRHGAPPVTVRISTTDDDLIVQVADEGPGLSDDALPRAFDRFYKGSASRSRTPGSGLGLSIARADALLHGGELVAQNLERGGAQFTLRMPRRQEDPCDA
jgi:two-component system sensor histidine kinase MtrB